MPKVLCISDTHNKQDSLTLGDADILIHAGDATIMGTRDEAELFINWFKSLPYAHKIFVPGNHDKFFLKEDWSMDVSGIHVLVHDEIIIHGLRIVGTCQRDELVLNRFTFDENPDILITHYPPKRILDGVPVGSKNYKGDNGAPEFLGNRSIKNLVEQLKPKNHIFGHVHECGGQDVIIEKIHYYNVACFNEYYLMVRPSGSYIEF